jgi:hypothetical protein
LSHNFRYTASLAADTWPWAPKTFWILMKKLFACSGSPDYRKFGLIVETTFRSGLWPKRPTRKMISRQGDQGPMLWFFKYFRRKFQRKNWRFWRKTKLVFAKIAIITLVFEKKRQFFRRKWVKIAENCDPPWSYFLAFFRGKVRGNFLAPKMWRKLEFSGEEIIPEHFYRIFFSGKSCDSVGLINPSL